MWLRNRFQKFYLILINLHFTLIIQLPKHYWIYVELLEYMNHFYQFQKLYNLNIDQIFQWESKLKYLSYQEGKNRVSGKSCNMTRNTFEKESEPPSRASDHILFSHFLWLVHHLPMNLPAWAQLTLLTSWLSHIHQLAQTMESIHPYWIKQREWMKRGSLSKSICNTERQLYNLKFKVNNIKRTKLDLIFLDMLLNSLACYFHLIWEIYFLLPQRGLLGAWNIL